MATLIKNAKIINDSWQRLDAGASADALDQAGDLVVPLALWNASRGPSTGCSPTTPGPLTSSTRLRASVMIQWRDSSCAGMPPVFVIVIV